MPATAEDAGADAATDEVSDAIRRAATPLADAAGSIADRAADARLVLLGEASHGTHEFYDLRAAITRRLVERHGFDAVVVEADWPDAYRVNRYVRGVGDDDSADDALGGFRRRFPEWMWRNRDAADLVAWLRGHNDAAGSGGRKVGFYGMDLYSLYGSVEAVLGYLEKVDPDAAATARRRYACLGQFGDPQRYGYAARFDVDESCRREVVRQLQQLMSRSDDYAGRDGRVAEDEYFFAEQNARLVANAEAYYRAMFDASASTWNLRDTHMADTLDALSAHLSSRLGRPARFVVWAHNSHLGDARHTQMGTLGGGEEVNVGQLACQRHGRLAGGGETYNVGFTTHAGTVTAADDWGDPPRTMTVNESIPDSYERLLHDATLAGAGGGNGFALPLDGDGPALPSSRLERAIGVVYRPATERLSHYFRADLARQFDAVVHVDRSSAVAPLDPPTADDPADAETYPSGV